MDNPQYTYIIQEREFVNSKEPVYKIGKTKQQNQKRFSSYPKGSILIQQFYCYDCDNIEKQIITLFNTKYKKRIDIGNEYYEGNFKQMIIDIHKIIDLETEIENDKTKIIKNEIVNDIIDDLITNVITVSEKKKIKKEKKYNYSCSFCAYNTNIKQDYDKHIVSLKHISNKEQQKTIEEIEEEMVYCCLKCNKKYKSYMGLWKHKKTCKV